VPAGPGALSQRIRQGLLEGKLRRRDAQEFVIGEKTIDERAGLYHQQKEHVAAARLVAGPQIREEVRHCHREGRLQGHAGPDGGGPVGNEWLRLQERLLGG
jgi:hypothetical protein